MGCSNLNNRVVKFLTSSSRILILFSWSLIVFLEVVSFSSNSWTEEVVIVLTISGLNKWKSETCSPKIKILLSLKLIEVFSISNEVSSIIFTHLTVSLLPSLS